MRAETPATRPDGGDPRRSGWLRAVELVACAIVAVAFAIVFMIAFGVGLVGWGEDPPHKPATKRGELETVEVGPPPDARVDVLRDVKERRRAETFAGVLPGGFPRTLPLPPPARLGGQGRPARGPRRRPRRGQGARPGRAFGGVAPGGLPAHAAAAAPSEPRRSGALR